MKAFIAQLLVLLVTALPAVAQSANTQKLYHYHIGMYSRQPIFGKASVFRTKNPQLSDRWGDWARSFTASLSDSMQQTSGCQGRGKFLLDIYRDGQVRAIVLESSIPDFAQQAVSAMYSMPNSALAYPASPATDCFHLYIVLGGGPQGVHAQELGYVQAGTMGPSGKPVPWTVNDPSSLDGEFD